LGLFDSAISDPKSPCTFRNLLKLELDLTGTLSRKPCLSGGDEEEIIKKKSKLITGMPRSVGGELHFSVF
jgi:hypothetical protein